MTYYSRGLIVGMRRSALLCAGFVERREAVGNIYCPAPTSLEFGFELSVSACEPDHDTHKNALEHLKEGGGPSSDGRCR